MFFYQLGLSVISPFIDKGPPTFQDKVCLIHVRVLPLLEKSAAASSFPAAAKSENPILEAID
jgi:hypothetical protein